MKNEKYQEKFNNVTTAIKSFTSTFCLWKNMNFAQKEFEKNIVYFTTFLVLFIVVRYLKRSNETRTST